MRERINFCYGSIIKKILLFSLPIIMGELLQNLYHSVDSIVVGNFVSKAALASVSVSDVPANLLVSFFNGMSLGSTAIVARAFGMQNKENLARAMRVTFSFSVLMGLLMSFVGLFCAPLLLTFTGVDAAIYDSALVYLRIYMVGMIFTTIYNIGSGTLRAIGDARTPFVILAFACSFNIVLDLFFVIVFRLGVVGVGLATVIAQGTSAYLVYRRLKREEGFRVDIPELRTSGSSVRELLYVGAPTGLQNSMFCISNLFVWKYINTFSIDAVTGIGIAQRLDRFVGMPCKAFGMTLTTFVAQNEGAGNHRRGRQGLWWGLGVAFATVSVIGIAMYFCAAEVISIFSRDAAVIEIGITMMQTLIPFYFLLYAREALTGVLRGYGDTRIPTLFSVFGIVLVRQAYLAYTMANAPRVEAIFYCFPIAWIAAITPTVIYAFFRLRQEALRHPEDEIIQQ